MPDTPRDIQRYLDQPLDDLTQEFALYREQATGTTRGFSDAWEKIVPALKQKICDEGNWCERRQDARFDEPMTVITLVISMIAPAAMQWQVPAALIAVILFKRGIDAFCGCPPMGAKSHE